MNPSPIDERTAVKSTSIKESVPALPRPKAVYLIIGLLSLEILAVMGLGLSMLLSAYTAGIGVSAATLVLVFAFVLIAGAIALGAKGLYDGRLFSRALILVWQIFGVIIGTQIAIAGQPQAGIPAIIIAGVIILLLFSGPVLGYLRKNYDAYESR